MWKKDCTRPKTKNKEAEKEGDYPGYV